MATYYMPVIFEIQADSIEEARNSLEEWQESIDLDNEVPTGTEDIDVSPTCEINDDGMRIFALPAVDDDIVSDDIEEDDEKDDFNISEEEPS